MPNRKAKKSRRSGKKLGDLTARAMILAGAGQVFTQHGVREPTVEMILEAAQVSRRTFYRLYSGKEDVMMSLYDFGVGRLVTECRTALNAAGDLPLWERFQLCVDAHLRNAWEFGRLVYVLGGDAQHQDSQLYPRRMAAHRELARLVCQNRPDVDTWLVHGVLLALEGVTRLMLEEGDQGWAVAKADYERARRVMAHIAQSALSGEGA